MAFHSSVQLSWGRLASLAVVGSDKCSLMKIWIFPSEVLQECQKFRLLSSLPSQTLVYKIQVWTLAVPSVWGSCIQLYHHLFERNFSHNRIVCPFSRPQCSRKRSLLWTHLKSLLPWNNVTTWLIKTPVKVHCAENNLTVPTELHTKRWKSQAELHFTSAKYLTGPALTQVWFGASIDETTAAYTTTG